MPLVNNIWKEPHPLPPGQLITGSIPPTAQVDGGASVPVELRMEGIQQTIPVGVDLVFLIDNSGSMDNSDPDGKRFDAIQSLINQFQPGRNSLDRIAIYLMSGSAAELVQPWSSWSATSQTIAQLAGGGSGKTPMAHGMNATNNLLAGSDGFFKMVVLLSDGLPTEDNLTEKPYETITGLDLPSDQESLISKAFRERILYSTIYLCPEPSAFVAPVNTLLAMIARGTDYVTEYTSLSDTPAFYFNISETDAMAAAYADLFNTVKDRALPQNVIIREKISDKLLIDGVTSISLTGDYFTPEQNILGFGAEAENAGVSSLGDAFKRFAETGEFEIHLNELRGELALRFSVKLDLENIPPEELPDDYISVDVDILTAEHGVLRYLEPTGGPGSVERVVTLPQARILFGVGVSARKIYEPSGTGNVVRIEVTNVSSTPAEWCAVAEQPSGFVNVADVQDDFGFDPFDLICSGHFKGWFFDRLWKTASKHNVYGMRHWSIWRQREVSRDWKRRVGTLVDGFRAKINADIDFNAYLKRFSCRELPPEANDIDRFWRTESQRGIYCLARQIPPLGKREIRFTIQDASFLIDDGIDQFLNWPVDAIFPKSDIELSKSWYRAAGFQNERQLLPNPRHGQIASHANAGSDLYVETCFTEKDLVRLRRLFMAPLLPEADRWKLLDSEGIKVTWGQRGFGASVRVINHGARASNATRMTVRSYLMALSGVYQSAGYEFPEAYAYRPLPILSARQTVNVPAIPATGYRDIAVDYGHLLQNVPDRLQLDLGLVKHGILVNVVDIAVPRKERFPGNNQAIEIVPIGIG